MKHSFISKVKQVFLNQPYLALYPISNKTEEEKNSLVTAFNTCDPGEGSEVSVLLSTLYTYALNKITMARLDEENIERNLSYSYKTKKTKTKNKETGEKEITKSKVEKKGAKRTIEMFQRRKDNKTKETERYEDLVQAFENSTLTIEHLALCDELLKENKYKKWIYTILLIAVVAIPILVFVLAKVFQM